ncbi:MAG: TIGR04168 family protein, partial [Cyanobacteria bacterium P01_F01_bin.153]
MGFEEQGRSLRTIAVVGDVHDQWLPSDRRILAGLGIDAALFVGDFGNESVEVVRAIAEMPVPKAVVMGN